MFYVLVATGLILLLLGGELLVRGAVSLARRLGVSPLVIGLTIIAYGTSAPELLVSLEAHLSGTPGIAVGNIVGSNIANVLLIVGCGALIHPIACAPHSIRITGPVLLGATVLLVALGFWGTITPWAGLSMLAMLFAFTAFSYREDRQSADRSEAAQPMKEVEEYGAAKDLPITLIMLGAGIAGVIVGSHYLITGAVALAREFGISEETIGLTLVAIGTSLPELATALVAAYRRYCDVALGNVIGSNIFNTLGIMGVVPLFGDLAFPPGIAAFDCWIMLFVTAFLVVWIVRRHSVGRGLAAVFLIAYSTYIGSHFLGLTALLTPGI